ncbi:MAG: hypothetical protein R3B72_27765 [Polyangiaceae bacterium]
MSIDFTEVPPAHKGGAKADTWEFFARDFLQALGLEHESGPDRGPDDGRDLIMVERRTGPLASKGTRWVVSAKHKVHGGAAVSDSEEVDVAGRVDRFEAHGFIAVYSTLPSSTLGRTLERLKSRMEIQVFDSARIEHALLTEPSLEVVFRRYFPKSFRSWEVARHGPVPLVAQYEPLECIECGKDLLAPDLEAGNVVMVYDTSVQPETVHGAYVCCKECNRPAAVHHVPRGMMDRWHDLEDIIIPRRFFELMFALVNEHRSGDVAYTSKGYRYTRHPAGGCPTRRPGTSKEQVARLKTLGEFPF